MTFTLQKDRFINPFNSELFEKKIIQACYQDFY